MSVTVDSLRDEYAAAVERMAGRALDALTGGGGTVAFTRELSRAELAAVRVLGPDLFAPALFHPGPLDPHTAQVAVEACQAFPPPAGGDTVLTGWHDWATGQLAARAGLTLTMPAPDRPPAFESWQQWSLAMARLAPLALPGLDSPLHEMVRGEAPALARGTVRAMLRRDHRTAARLTRWMAWLHSAGVPAPVESAPLLLRLRQVSDGSARATLDLTLAHRLLTTETR
ncbi:hypothetical protein [Streptomyces sp. NPDC002990]